MALVDDAAIVRGGFGVGPIELLGLRKTIFVLFWGSSTWGPCESTARGQRIYLNTFTRIWFGYNLCMNIARNKRINTF